MVPALSGGQVRQFLEMSLQELVLPCPSTMPPILHLACHLLLVVGLLKGVSQEQAERREALKLHVGVLFVFCIELDVTSTGNTGIYVMLFLMNSFSSFFIWNLSGGGSENYNHLIRMPSAVCLSVDAAS